MNTATGNTAAASIVGMENSVQIARAMQYADNLDSVRQLFIGGAKREIFLIVDCGPAHIAKKTRTFVESLKGKLRLFYLPPYAPEFSRRSS